MLWSTCVFLMHACVSVCVLQVISGHLGWVRCLAVEPGNQWFVTGSADRTIKVWIMKAQSLHSRHELIP